MSFGGIPAAQRIQDYYLWEVVLNENPQLRGIVELGTWEGGFACYLAAQARSRKIWFRTYDVRPPEHDIPGFVQLDVFRKAEEVGRLLREWEPVIVLCDGGNKPREVQTFSRHLGPESLLVAHDWGMEISIREIPDNVEMVYGDLCESINSLSRVFRVRDA